MNAPIKIALTIFILLLILGCQKEQKSEYDFDVTAVNLSANLSITRFEDIDAFCQKEFCKDAKLFFADKHEAYSIINCACEGHPDPKRDAYTNMYDSRTGKNISHLEYKMRVLYYFAHADQEEMKERYSPEGYDSLKRETELYLGLRIGSNSTK